MTDRSTNCPRCYAPLRPTESPGGLCPKCLLAVAMGEEGQLRTASGAPVAPPPPVEDLAPHFPQLDILELIGRGGAGAVYRAVQRDLGRPVALKILLLDPARDPAFGERFAREARAMAGLSHPNIAAVHDAGRAGPYWYLLLELVDGPNLRQLIRTRDVTPAQALDLVRQMSSALEYAHECGVVHRDIKPENVLVDARGNAKLVDFGLAKLLGAVPGGATLTGSAQAMGTWHYMAPEQLRRPLEVDHRADIYALGVVLYELLTGEVPVGRYEPPSRRSLADRRVDAIVDRALEQDPDRRYQEARGVREDVERLRTPAREDAPAGAQLAAVRTPASEPAEPLRGARHGHGTGWRWGCGCLALLAVAFATLLLLWFGLRAHGIERSLPPGVPFHPIEVGLPNDAPDAALLAVRDAWERYLALEEAHTSVLGEVEEGDLGLRIEAFPEEREALVAGLVEELDTLCPGWTVDGRRSVLEALFPYGKQPVELAVDWRDDGRFELWTRGAPERGHRVLDVPRWRYERFFRVR